MPSFASDTFTDTSGTALTAHTCDSGGTWFGHPVLNAGGAGSISAAGRAYGGITTCYLYCNDPPTTANYSVLADMVYAGSGSATIVGVCGRMDDTVDTMYTLQRDANSIDLYKRVAGAVTQLATVVIVGANCNLELAMNGTTIEGYVIEASSGEYVTSGGTTQVARVACISVTDSAITAAGFAGINLNNSGATTRFHLDNFLGSEASTYTETVSSTIVMVDAVSVKAYRRPLYFVGGKRIGKLPAGEYINGTRAEFLVVTLTDLDDATYYYYGGLTEDGEWQINRYLKSDVTSKYVAIESPSNTGYTTLSAAWTNRTTLVYG